MASKFNRATATATATAMATAMAIWTIRERLARENMQLLGIWFFIAVVFLVCFEPFLCTFERSSICCCLPMLLLMRNIRGSISLGRLDLRIACHQEIFNRLL